MLHSGSCQEESVFLDYVAAGAIWMLAGLAFGGLILEKRLPGTLGYLLVLYSAVGQLLIAKRVKDEDRRVAARIAALTAAFLIGIAVEGFI